jgi:hypothetical protein
MVDDSLLPIPPVAPKRKSGFLGIFKRKEVVQDSKQVSGSTQASADAFIDNLSRKYQAVEAPVLWPDEHPADMASDFPDLPDLDVPELPVIEEKQVKQSKQTRRAVEEIPPYDIPSPAEHLDSLPELPEIPDWDSEPSPKEESRKAVESMPEPVPEVPHEVVVNAERVAKVHSDSLKKELAPSVQKSKKGAKAKKLKSVDAKPAREAVRAINEDIDSVVGDLHVHNQALEEDLSNVVSSQDHGEIHPAKYFVLQNGQYLKSFRDLVTAVDKMDDSMFEYHVTGDRHDFANWVKDVLKQEQLASRMKTARVKKELLAILKRHVVEVDSILDKQRRALLSRKRENLALIERLKNSQAGMSARASDFEKREMAVAERERASEAKIHSRLLMFERAIAARERAMGVKEKEQLASLTAGISRAKSQLANLRSQIESDRKAADAEAAKKESLLKRKEATIKQQLTAAQNLEQERIKLKGLQDKFEFKLKRLDEDRAKFEKEVSSAKQMLAKASALTNQEHRLDVRSKDLESREHHLVSKTTQVQKEKSSLRKEEESLAFEKKDAEQGVFDKYLQSKLKEIQPRVEAPVDVPLRQHKLYDDINVCRELLSQGRIEAAKGAYNKIKSDFQKAKVSSSEKNMLYNAVRELYDDIHLAMLSSEQYK